MDLLLDEQAAAGAAALALVEEQAEVGPLDGGVEVGVGEDDVGALAAQLQADALEVALGGGGHDGLAGVAVYPPVERRILAPQEIQSADQLLLVG